MFQTLFYLPMIYLIIFQDVFYSMSKSLFKILFKYRLYKEKFQSGEKPTQEMKERISG
jgi:hypothetical protein